MSRGGVRRRVDGLDCNQQHRLRRPAATCQLLLLLAAAVCARVTEAFVLQPRFSPQARPQPRSSIVDFSRAHVIRMMAVPPGGRNPNPQSVLVVGAGAVGCVYGGRLLEAGHDVAFLMRREYEAVKAKGLTIASPDGDLFFPSPAVVRSTREYSDMRGGRPADWVILALKTTSFHEIPMLLGDGVLGPDTRVLALMNGYGLERDLAPWVDGSKIFGGMAFVCANRGPHGSGEVAHLKYGKLAIGHYRDDPQELARVEQLWDGAKIEVETAPSLLKARWQKLCWNVPFNGIGVVLGGMPTTQIVGTPELRQLASQVMLDVIKAANAELALASANDAASARQAFASSEEAEAAARDTSTVRLGAAGESALRIERAFHDHMFALTDVMGEYMSSTVLDLLAQLPMETEYMFNKPLARARELGVAVPHMESVCLAVEGIRKTRGL